MNCFLKVKTKTQVKNEDRKSNKFRSVCSRGDIVGEFFKRCHSNYHIDPRAEVKEFENSDTRLSLMIVNNRVHAFVIETRTAFNDLEYIKGMVDKNGSPEPIIP